MARYERVKPPDTFFNEMMLEFGSGGDRVRDKDFDEMVWELGDYENVEPPMEILEFEPEGPIEEELAEKKKIPARAKAPFKHVRKPRGRRAAAGAAR
jgi:hypothetical protein